MNEYQLIVIGAGPGGYEAAIRAAQLGDDLFFALMNLFPIKGSVFGVKSKQLKLGCFPVELCGVEHRLGGDAAAV